MCAENSFDELLNLVEMNHQLACDPEAGGCGKLNHIHHILENSPHIFITGSDPSPCPPPNCLKKHGKKEKIYLQLC